MTDKLATWLFGWAEVVVLALKRRRWITGRQAAFLLRRIDRQLVRRHFR